MEELEQFQLKQQIENKNKSVIQRYWEGKWNERRLDVLDECQTQDVVYHGTSMSMNGINEYREVYGSYLAAFQDTSIEIVNLIAENDLVMSHVTLTCKHVGELDGIPPTGNVVTTSAFTIFRMVDEKIAEEWEMLDELGMMMELGMQLQMKETSQ